VFKGCKYVVHCASPVVFQAEDPERDIIKPAVEGTTNVLRAAVAAGVTRVVYTATMASICGSQREKDPDHVWTEEDWNDAPGTHYSRSKTLAEKAAWDFAKEHPQLEFVTIHPSYVIGPMTLKRAEGYSVEGMIKLLRGDFKDVRIHLLSLINDTSKVDEP
jgi:nucleoside-diphosphate-sugar epimerase